MGRPRLWVLAPLALAACSVHVDHSSTRFACSDGVCPDGYECVNAVCVTDAPPDDPPDASSIAPTPDASTAGAPDATVDIDAIVELHNIAPNGGAEDGLSWWSSYQGTVADEVDNPHSGAHAVLVCKTVDQLNQYFTGVLRADLDPLQHGPDTPISITAWVRAPLSELQTPPATVELTLKERGGDVAEYTHPGTPVALSGMDWIELTLETSIRDPGRTHVHARIATEAEPDGTCFAVDDVVILAP